MQIDIQSRVHYTHSICVGKFNIGYKRRPVGMYLQGRFLYRKISIKIFQSTRTSPRFQNRVRPLSQPKEKRTLIYEENCILGHDDTGCCQPAEL